MEDLNRLLKRYNIHSDLVWRLTRNFSLIVMLAYFSASVANTIFMTVFMGSIESAFMMKKKGGNVAASPGSISWNKSFNYVDANRRILERNLFNSSGELPKEPEPSKQSSAGFFDPDAPCQKTSLKISLLGTIYLGPRSASLATIKDDSFTEADVYKSGDLVIGSEALIYSIEPQKVVINNNGVKECLELLPPAFMNQDGVESGISDAGPSDEAQSTSVTLDQAFVEKELGPGFANIISKGRLVPHMPDGVMKGFKMIGMDAGSLYGKIGLKNNDLITAVNDNSMVQPDQGFALYEAFEGARDIRITIVRDEKPRTILVRIK